MRLQYIMLSARSSCGSNTCTSIMASAFSERSQCTRRRPPLRLYATTLPVGPLWVFVLPDALFVHLDTDTRPLSGDSYAGDGKKTNLYPSFASLGTLYRPFLLIEHG